MTTFTKEQYEYALERIEELLPVVDGYHPEDRNAVELSILSDIVIEYEKEYYPIEKPTVAELISSGLDEKSMTQKDLAKAIGSSPSRISEFVSGKAFPTLAQAGKICLTLGIEPALILGL